MGILHEKCCITAAMGSNRFVTMCYIPVKMGEIECQVIVELPVK